MSDPWHSALAGLPLAAIHAFARLDSTNTRALQLAREGAADLTLVMADEQTAGRGRAGRRWFTPPGSALALSLVLRPGNRATPAGHYAALGALAVCQALEDLFRLHPQVKWPNDVLLQGSKVAGVLPEALWEGHALQAVVLGIGINVTPAAVPPTEALDFPATCVERVVGQAVSRPALLRAVIEGVLAWRPRLGTPAFLQAWEGRLAFRGQRVWVWQEEGPPQQGILLGLDAAGRLKVRDPQGQVRLLSNCTHLRPATGAPGNTAHSRPPNHR